MPLATGIPGRLAQAPRMGLVTAAQGANSLVTQPESKWMNGVAYETEACVTPSAPIDICTPGAFAQAQPPASSEWVPYVAYADWTCSTFSVGNALDEAYAVARRRLDATWQWQMEFELWTGTLAQVQSYPNRWLADAANVADLSGGAGVTPLNALACLTQYLADNTGGQQGMIHATPAVVTHWADEGAVYRQGNVILTKVRDDVVVAGNGYPGTTPDGDAPVDGNVWAYATDIVEVREGSKSPNGIDGNESAALKPIQWVNPTNNVIVVRAQKRVLASFEGCRHAGIRIDIPVCLVGS